VHEPAKKAQTDTGPPISRLAVFLISAGVLVLEIASTRIFSFALWYHFAYVALSVSLLGYGAAGAILASSATLARVPPARLLGWSIQIAIAGVLVSLCTILFMPFKPFAIVSSPINLIATVAFFVLASAPHFGAGLAMACAFRVGRSPNEIYFADLLGAGVGCLAALGAIWFFGAPGATVASAGAFLVACMLVTPRAARARAAAIAGITIALCAALVVLVPFRPSADKFLAKVMASGGRIWYSRWSPIFRVDVYDPPASRTIAARGVSPRFHGQLPQTRFVAHDGTAEAPMHEFTGDMAELDFLARNVSAAPYVIADRPEVLVIGLGGGFDVLNAIRNGAGHVTGVELDPLTVDVVQRQQAAFVGNILSRPDVDVVVAEGRSFLRHAPRRWDLIQLTGVDTLAALSTGAYLLAESYLYTVDAFDEYLDHLTPDGTLSLMIGDMPWPTGGARFALRHVMNFVAVAERRGLADPASCAAIVAVRNGPTDMLELLFKPRPFTAAEVATLKQFVDDNGFEVVHLPGVATSTPHTRLLTETPAGRRRLLAEMPLDVAAISDNQPFFFHFYRWHDLLDRSKWEVDTGHAGITGQVVLAAILAASIVTALVFVIAPLLLAPRLRRPGRGRFAVYFAALGLGFMFIEVSLIQRSILFLGHPTYAVAIVLFALLMWTGIGSHVAGRIDAAPRTIIGGALVALLALVPFYGWGLPMLMERWLGAPALLRYAITVALLFPLGLTLGVFFPTGLREVRVHDELLVPWAWGANGGASVVGSIGSIVLAMAFGFRAVFVIAGAVYVVGVACLVLGRART
jgi:hypothetical protein